jgi:hypothetical protein
MMSGTERDSEGTGGLIAPCCPTGGTKETHEKLEPVHVMSPLGLTYHLAQENVHELPIYLTCYMSRLSHMEVKWGRKDGIVQSNAARWRAPFRVSLASGATLAGCHVNPVRSSLCRGGEVIPTAG